MASTASLSIRATDGTGKTRSKSIGDIVPLLHSAVAEAEHIELSSGGETVPNTADVDDIWEYIDGLARALNGLSTDNYANVYYSSNVNIGEELE